ncbi:MAG: methyltransferase domain-containing protein [Verrucomicrobiota bacterium]
MSFTSFLKSLPIDLGQGNLRGTTKGKLIALEHVESGNGKTALDVGCREGIQSEWLKSEGYTVTSIDVEKVYDEAQVIDANEDLPYPDESYDLIWCSEVIEHLEDPKHFRDEAFRMLKHGGQLLLTTPNSYFWFYTVAGLFGKTRKELQNPTHLQFFRERDIRKIFPEAKIYGFFPYFLLRFRISSLLSLLTPTFVVILRK